MNRGGSKKDSSKKSSSSSKGGGADDEVQRLTIENEEMLIKIAILEASNGDDI
jgi:hypothetical protein